jgi:hypothetical protein
LPSLQQFNHLPITNHERQLAVQRFAQQEAHRLREKLLVAETAAHNLLRQMADSQGLVEAKQAEMEDIRCDLVAAKQLCQQLAKQMISKNKVLAEQIRLNDDLELKLAETLRAPSEKKADQSQQSTTGSLLKRIDTDELTQKSMFHRVLFPIN